MTEQSKKPIAYICCPYSGDVEANTKVARRYARFAAEQGRAPLAVTLMLPQFVDEATKRELVWVCGDRISEGMRSEIKSAQHKGIVVRYFNEEDIKCTK